MAGKAVAQIVEAKRRSGAVVDPGVSRGALQPAAGHVVFAVWRAVRGREHPIGAFGEAGAASLLSEQPGQLRHERDISDRRGRLGSHPPRRRAAGGARELGADMDLALIEVDVLPDQPSSSEIRSPV